MQVNVNFLWNLKNNKKDFDTGYQKHTKSKKNVFGFVERSIGFEVFKMI